MKTLLLLIFLIAGGFSLAEAQSISWIKIDDFESDSLGNVPSKWYNRDGEKKPAYYGEEESESYHYAISKEGDNQFLRYDGTDAKHLMFPLNDFDINLRTGTELRWKWRANQLPEDAEVEVKEKNDVVLSVYVVFSVNMFKMPKVIRYVWATNEELGEEISLNFGNQKVIVLRNKDDKMGTWIEEQRNLLDDYHKVFSSRAPSKPLAILILSDGNDTNSVVKGDYDDIFVGQHQ